MTRRRLVEAGRVLHAAKVKWFELRHFFRASCEWAVLQAPQRPLPHEAISFMLGNYVPGELDSPGYSLFKPETIKMFRSGYSQVEQKCFK